jgi:hypothetical protein
LICFSGFVMLKICELDGVFFSLGVKDPFVMINV